MKRRFLAAGFLFILLLLSGCSTSPVSRYPDFLERKKAFSSSIILADCVLIDAIPGDTAHVDVPMNKKIGKVAIDYLSGTMNQKGYRVDRSLLGSIGLIMDQNNSYRVLRTPEDQLLDPAERDLESPPFYVDSIFLRNEVLGKLYRIVLSSLINTTKEGNGPDVVIPGAAGLGKALGGGNLVILLIGGFSVPVAGQVGRFTPSPSAGAGKIGFQRASQCTVRLYLLDSTTGELIWDDQSYVEGGVIHTQKILDLTGNVADRLP